LQVLDDGRLTDFKNTIIIMTTNIGSNIIQENFGKMTDENYFEVLEGTRDEVLALLKTSVRPEFINRIDEIIMFRPLSRKDIRKIVDIQVDIIRRRLDAAGVRIDVSEAARERLAKLGYDPQFGARPLKRVMQREILNELSKQILAGKVHKDAVIYVDLKDEVQFIFENLEEPELVR
jgi:ATP-dependent Clp protease ATP-binding subunit ClpB